MKLRKKETGEIGYFCFANWNDPVLIIMDKDGVQLAKYNSLAEMNAEWEDYKEPKEYWFISTTGEVHRFEGEDKTYTPSRKQIGNYFETREEAEEAVEKLRAWKRVKRDLVSLNWQRERDGSFSVWGEFKTGNTLRADVYLDIHSKDLDLLFSGEDD